MGVPAFAGLSADARSLDCQQVSRNPDPEDLFRARRADCRIQALWLCCRIATMGEFVAKAREG
jgi:hypothetical protein